MRSDYLAHSNPLFHKTGILKVHDVYKYSLSIYMYRNKEKMETVSDLHNYKTRYNNHIQPKFQRLLITQRSLSYCAPKVWNEIPQNIQNSSSLSSFKSNYKKYLIDLYSN